MAHTIAGPCKKPAGWNITLTDGQIIITVNNLYCDGPVWLELDQHLLH